ncbi:MAG: hypothetical protein NTY91_08680 [Euryarchaeota archaeon]|jgi:hypothetical protein|nr:hypothetical protein [Euryarchaeota archaeon]
MEMDLELTNTETKIKKEMKHFMALTIMSLAFGAMAMAFAIATITTNVLALTKTISNMYFVLVSLVIGFIVAFFALRYVISSAEVFSKFDEIQDEKTGEKNLPREKLTEYIVKLMALYRDEKPQIKRMMLVSKIAGVCFYANALFQTAILGFNLYTGTADLIPAVGGILVSAVMGTVGFFLPFSFLKYAVCWENRLAKSRDAEKRIASFMEEQ